MYNRRWILIFLTLFVLPVVQHVCGLEVHTPSEVEAVNGTDVKLKCTFSSTYPVSQAISVTWNFRGINSKTDESLFFYSYEPFPPEKGPFKDRVIWSGDVQNKDASITLLSVPPTFNGTYTCQVKNPPDVHGNNGELILKVVNKVTLSEIGLLAAVVGGACGLILVFLGIVMVVKYCRKKRMERGIEMHPDEFEKGDPSVFSPAEAVHLTVVKKEKEAANLNVEEPEPSRGDDEEEGSLGGDDDD